MTALLIVLYLLASLPLLLAILYLLLLTVLSGTPRPPGAALPRRFVVVVPAHNEAACIERTVKSLLALDWPSEQWRLWVVADNCSDDTAALARAAGAEVLERHSETERGKGYALQHAYTRLLDEGWAEAVVVVDADSEVSPNLLRAFAARLAAGAQAVQAYYGVLNPQASWRTRLVTIALALMHRVRPRGRERLGMSAGLRGNGMCFSTELLRRVPHQAYSLVEDLEYAIRLAAAGVRVHYADEASVDGEMASSGSAAASQRQRWEGGRAQMIRLHGGSLLARALDAPSRSRGGSSWRGLPLLRHALRAHNRLAFDTAMEVLIPPLSTLALGSLAAGLAGGLLVALAGAPPALLAVPALMLGSLVLHVLRGVQLSGLGWGALGVLLFAPLFVLWKLGLRLRRGPGSEWIRTRREGESP